MDAVSLNSTELHKLKSFNIWRGRVTRNVSNEIIHFIEHA